MSKMPPSLGKKPSTVDEFQARLIGERHLFTSKMLEAGAWVLDNPRLVALETLSVLAESSRLTPSIFVRLAKAMGFEGFSDMQRIFRAPLHEVFPVTLSERISHSHGDEQVHNPDDIIALGQSFCRANSASLAHLGERLAELPLDAVIDRMISARSVHVIGLDRSFPVAAYLSYALRRAGVQAVHVTGMGSSVEDQISVMVPGDVLASISFPPYAQNTIAATAIARDAGHPIIAITDTPVSPITEGATDILSVEDAELHGFRSLTAVMSLVQTVTIGIAYRQRKRSGDINLDEINA